MSNIPPSPEKTRKIHILLNLKSSILTLMQHFDSSFSTTLGRHLKLNDKLHSIATLQCLVLILFTANQREIKHISGQDNPIKTKDPSLKPPSSSIRRFEYLFYRKKHGDIIKEDGASQRNSGQSRGRRGYTKGTRGKCWGTPGRAKEDRAR